MFCRTEESLNVGVTFVTLPILLKVARKVCVRAGRFASR